MIKLVGDTVSKKDIDDLCKWLQTYPRLTKGEKTVEFEEKWSKRIGSKYSVYVNSGSSANLLMIYALLQQKRLHPEDVVAVPAISWTTTVTPLMQFGLHPILVDADKDSLGIDPEHFESVCKLHSPKALVLVHALGFPCKMKEIMNICKKYNVILLEDTCESLGSMYDGKNVGTFGLMGTYSLYFGHHISTIEGGVICTDDFRTYEMLKMLRSHGWDRDLSSESQEFWRKTHGVDDFNALYTFYVPGFNLRSTDLQAFMGLGQLDKLPSIGRSRFDNFTTYTKLIKNSYWKANSEYANVFVSNFAYPVIHPNIKSIVADLQKNDVEVRPLIAGNIGKQPMFSKIYGKCSLPFADIVHEYGCYLPNHAYLEKSQIEFVCDIVNHHT